MAGDESDETKRAVGGVGPLAIPGGIASSFPGNGHEAPGARTENWISHQHVTDRWPPENDGRCCPASCDVRHVEKVIIVAMTNKNHRGVIGRSWKQSLYRCRIGGDSRAASQPPKHTWSRDWERGIAEERRRQQRVPTPLDEHAGNTQVGDGHHISRVSTVTGRAADSTRSRCDLVRDNRRVPTTREDNQRARNGS